MSPSAVTTHVRCAVRSGAGPAEDAILAAYLERHGLSDVVRFAPKDDEELYQLLSSGRFQRVVFAGLDALLDSFLKGNGESESWKATGLRIELADRTVEDNEALQVFLADVCQGAARWRRTERRRKLLASVILSALALLALAVLLLLSLTTH